MIRSRTGIQQASKRRRQPQRMQAEVETLDHLGHDTLCGRPPQAIDIPTFIYALHASREQLTARMEFYMYGHVNAVAVNKAMESMKRSISNTFRHR